MAFAWTIIGVGVALLASLWIASRATGSKPPIRSATEMSATRRMAFAGPWILFLPAYLVARALGAELPRALVLALAVVFGTLSIAVSVAFFVDMTRARRDRQPPR